MQTYLARGFDFDFDADVIAVAAFWLTRATDLQSTNATIRVLKVCGLDDHSIVLREMLEVDYCSVTLPGKRFSYIQCMCVL